MDNETYLIKRGWRVSESGLTWVDPQDQWAPARVFLAVQIQTERDAEQLDIATARVAELEGTIESVKSYLKDITRIADNLPDETVEAIGGVNDGKSRALMVVYARKFARQALKTLEGALGGQPNAHTK